MKGVQQKNNHDDKENEKMGKDVINKVCKLTIGHSHTKQNWNFYLIISIEKRLDFLNKSTKDIFPIKKSSQTYIILSLKATSSWMTCGPKWTMCCQSEQPQ